MVNDLTLYKDLIKQKIYFSKTLVRYDLFCDFTFPRFGFYLRQILRIDFSTMDVEEISSYSHIESMVSSISKESCV